MAEDREWRKRKAWSMAVAGNLKRKDMASINDYDDGRLLYLGKDFFAREDAARLFSPVRRFVAHETLGRHRRALHQQVNDNN